MQFIYVFILLHGRTISQLSSLRITRSSISFTRINSYLYQADNSNNRGVNSRSHVVGQESCISLAFRSSKWRSCLSKPGSPAPPGSIFAKDVYSTGVQLIHFSANTGAIRGNPTHSIYLNSGFRVSEMSPGGDYFCRRIPNVYLCNHTRASISCDRFIRNKLPGAICISFDGCLLDE